MFSTILKRMRRGTRVLIPFVVLFCVAASVAPAQRGDAAKPSVEAARLRAHVEYLASDKLEGRKTGTRGAELAAEYIAAEFKRLHLAPGGGAASVRRDRVELREYMQTFPYVAGVELGKGNSMTFISPDRTTMPPPQPPPYSLALRLGEHWMPLGFSANGRVEKATVVFVGYGITAADLNYDDYAGTGVAGKIALAFAGTPDGDNPHGKFTRAGELRFKAAAARAAGARALVLVAREESFKDDKLSRLSFDNSGGDAGLPVVVISRLAAASVLGLETLPRLSEVETKVREWKFAVANKTEASPVAVVLADVPLTITTDIVRKRAPASNVVGVLHGSDPKLRNEVIVVGAHYDHLGHGGRGSLAAREGEIHHGADDNASGTAALIELARLLSAERDKLRRTVVFIAFGGEEEGLLGSSHYVAHPAKPIEQTVAMLNMDMVGRLKDETLMIGGVGTAAEWRAWVEGANSIFDVKVDPMGNLGRNGQTAGEPAPVAATSPAPGSKTEPPVVVNGSNGRVVATAVPGRRFTLRLNEDGFGPSDHSSFYARRVPVLFFFTGSHEDYHKPSDTAERLNYEGLARVSEFVREIVGGLQANEARPTFAVARTESNARSTGFRVYLGTVPSYGESTDGLKLDAVREGSPAEAAGLKAGDRIVRLAGRDVRNVYDYTQALSGMKAGQQYEVEVVRAEQRMTFKVTPAARK